MSLAKQEFTNAGRSMLGRAQNTEILHVTKLVIGSGVAAQPSDLWPRTALISPKLDVAISTRRDYGDGTLLVEGSFRSDQATSTFQMREIGVMAHIGAEADRLYSLANVFADPPDTIDPASPAIHAFKVKLIIDRIPTGQLDVSIGPAEAITGENIGGDAVGAGVYKEAIGNVLRYKRLVEGEGIDITDDVDTITIGARILQNDLDVYVPANHPNCPDPKVGFATVQLAHDYLLQFMIPPSKFARINIWQGTFTTASTITISHPNAKQISIIGWPRVDKTVTNIVYLNATSKDVFIADVTGLIAQQRVYLALCLPGWIGGCKILSSRPGAVTLSTLKRDTQAAFTQNQSATTRLSYFPTVLVNSTVAPTQAPVISCPNGIKQIENLCLDGKGYLLQLTEGGIKNCMFIGGRRGVNAYQGTIGLIGECVFTDCDFGLVSLGPCTAFDQTIVNACGTGLNPGGGGMAVGSITTNMPAAVVYLVHCTYGLLASTGGNFLGGTIFYALNDYGLAAQKMGVLSVGAAYGSLPQFNGIDLYAQGHSYIDYNRWQQPAPTCNPPAETLGNQNALIHVLNS